jgi:malate permease and related proteins
VGFAVPATQVSIMFGLIALGWLAFRVHWIGADALKGMTNLLLYLVSPAVIIQAFQRAFDPARLQTVGVVFLLDLASFAITAVVAGLLFNSRFVPDAAKRTALRFGTVFSNAGFIGIPLAQALLGDDGVFYAVAYIAAFTVFVWTYGVSLFGRNDEEPVLARVQKVLVNPNIVAIVIALAFYVFSLRLPSPLSNVLGYLSSMNTPLSMIVIGVTLAELSLRTIFTDRLVWLGALARNLIVPLLFVLLLWPLPLDHVARLAILISISAPVGAFLVIFCLRHNVNTRFSTRLLTLSTLLSVVTVPLVLLLAGLLW